MAVATILLSVVFLALVFYGFSLHITGKQEKSPGELPSTKPASSTPAQQSPKGLPPILTPEEQKAARDEHIILVERSLQAKFREVDLHVAKKALQDEAQRLAQAQADKQRLDYLDALAQQYSLQNQQPCLVAPPQIGIPQAQRDNIDLPWLPDNVWEPGPAPYRRRTPFYEMRGNKSPSLNPRNHNNTYSGNPRRRRTGSAKVAERIFQWLHNIPEERPPSVITNEQEGEDGGNDAQSTISVGSQMTHISI